MLNLVMKYNMECNPSTRVRSCRIMCFIEHIEDTHLLNITHLMMLHLKRVK